MMQVCSFYSGEYAIEVDGESIRFEWSEQFGPWPLTKTGKERRLGNRHKFWAAVTLWSWQGKRVEDGKAIWHIPKPPVVEHIAGNHYRVVENGERGYEVWRD